MSGMGVIMVVIHRFMKHIVIMITLIVCIIKIIVGLFNKNVVKNFGVSSNIISNHDI
jgi:hypothetical protein